MQPGSITVNNSNGDYTISGGGGITGGGALVKNGTRTLTISTNNSFSGGTTLNAGTLNVNNNGALGVGALTINGGILGNTSGQAVTLSANPTQNWNSDITFNGPSDLNLGTGAVTSTVTGGHGPHDYRQRRHAHGRRRHYRYGRHRRFDESRYRQR